MDRITEALNRAKAQRLSQGEQVMVGAVSLPGAGVLADSILRSRTTIQVSERNIRENRIVAHRPDSKEAAAFDVLRTKVLAELDTQGWRSVFVTSPTSGCGKTVTAINLALSIARQPDRLVVLVDLDLRRPQIAEVLGFKPALNLADALSGNGPISDVTVTMEIAPRLRILGNRAAVRGAAEMIVSRQTRELFDLLRNAHEKPIIIVDTPPVLSADDAVALLPQVDCGIIVAAERQSTIADIESAERLLEATNILGVVLSKSHERTSSYY
jgi:protein-tyrosine kinase